MATPLAEFDFKPRASLDRSTEGIDFGTRDAERLLPLPATATLAQDAPQMDPTAPPTFGPTGPTIAPTGGIQPPPATAPIIAPTGGIQPAPVPPPDAPPLPPFPAPTPLPPGISAPLTAAAPPPSPFTLTGPLDPSRTTPPQKTFLDAAGQALEAGDRDRILSLFGEQGTELGVFEDLSDKFVGNLALQVFPAVFSEFFQGNPSGEQTIFRIQQLLAGLTPGTPEADTFRPPGTTGADGVTPGDPGVAPPAAAPGAPGVAPPPLAGGAGVGFEPGNVGGAGPQIPLPELPTFDLAGPAAGGPGFPSAFPDAPPDELSELINQRLGGLIETGGITSLTDIPRGTEGVARLTRLADQDPKQIPSLSSSLFEAGAAGLQEQIQTGGLDPDLLFQVRQSLRENLESERRAGLSRLDEELSRRRIGGAGLEGGEVRRLDQRLQQEMFRNLRDVATQLGLSAADRQLAASNAAAAIGADDRNQRLRFLSERESRQLAAASGLSQAEIQTRAQDISLLQTQLATSLSAAEIATERALGIGQLGLANLGVNLAFIETAFNQRMQLAQFQEAAIQARQGNVNQLVAFLLNIANAMQQGFVV